MPCKQAFGLKHQLDRHKVSTKCLNFGLLMLPFGCPNNCGKRFLTIEQLNINHLQKWKCQNMFQCTVCPGKPFFAKKSEKNDLDKLEHSVVQQVNITLPPSDDKNNSMPRVLKISVPSNSLIKGSISNVSLQRVLADSIKDALSNMMSTKQAEGFIQTKINQTFNLK